MKDLKGYMIIINLLIKLRYNLNELTLIGGV